MLSYEVGDYAMSMDGINGVITHITKNGVYITDWGNRIYDDIIVVSTPSGIHSEFPARYLSDVRKKKIEEKDDTYLCKKVNEFMSKSFGTQIVREGGWETDYLSEYMCSICGGEPLAYYGDEHKYCLSKYCPHCGSKMVD